MAVMLKEIMSQPKLLEDCMRGRVNPAMGYIRLGGLEENGSMERLIAAKRIIICACGTSFHSGLVGEYLLESLARIPVEVEYASEFRYRNPIINAEDIIIVISQSGETADTLAALRLAKEKGCHTIGLVNVVRVWRGGCCGWDWGRVLAPLCVSVHCAWVHTVRQCSMCASVRCARVFTVRVHAVHGSVVDRLRGC